jgi:hypothetical protein
MAFDRLKGAFLSHPALAPEGPYQKQGHADNDCGIGYVEDVPFEASGVQQHEIRNGAIG